MSKVIIIDYKLSNLFSVQHACDHVGLEAKISSEVADIEGADGIILPGVGAFNKAMDNLSELGLIDPILAHVNAGKPFFGICLGLQLLFTESEEFGVHKGLELVKGTVKKFPIQKNQEPNFKVPQIAWNHINSAADRDFAGTPLEGLSDQEFMYFVHSFYVQPENSEDVLTTTGYGSVKYCSGIFKNKNIFAVQFHPEKSGARGLRIYKNWAEQYDLI